MDTLPLLAISCAALGGAVVGAGACYWPLSRVIAELRERLARSEQARSGAVERSAQTREQIAQLNRAITELRRTHSAHLAKSEPAAHTGPDRRATSREELERVLAESEAKTAAMQREKGQAFADTQVLGSI